MPRYFFHIQDGQDLPDHDGTVLGGPDNACVLAVRTAGHMIRAQASEFWTDRDWEMDVVDEADATVCQLRFSGTAGAS